MQQIELLTGLVSVIFLPVLFGWLMQPDATGDENIWASLPC